MVIMLGHHDNEFVHCLLELVGLEHQQSEQGHRLVIVYLFWTWSSGCFYGGRLCST